MKLMKPALPWLIALVVLAGLCRAFPPFHIRSLKAVREAQAYAQFNATDFVGRFWNEKLLPATGQAADATKVLAAIAAAPRQVREQFGRTVGVSSSYFLFVRGAGRVVSADADNIGLTLKPEGHETDIIVPLGLVFGNAVRDGTGLLNSSAYPNAQEFNDISAALNRIVETNVLPQLQQIATVGKRIQFAGCVEVGDEEQDLKPLKLVPISMKAE
jgi:predicted lipoprotein